ncbi:right-handed parallel beta-helix repeat-containing protein [Aquimarina brevivitae]|uniref:Putative secreted protein (Por secretion system target) n=1 Tax=Aquimarina brevivitae TaxID=323412 RepID=A0A4V2F5M0_9FLAO|nr:T9SS type A sorting domain-containing protein [Aquimarina brevivitae]RZS93289.1 putative secreted protein (Por secretion system target) [Aquimarina brevivitae]
MKFNFLTTLLVFLFATLSIGAKTYYVSPNGNDNNSGNLSDPLQTLHRAIDLVSSGDIIYLRGGNHNYSNSVIITKNGNSSNPIKVFAYNGENAVLNFAMSENSSNRGVVLEGDYWHWKGITIQGAGDNGMLLSGNNNIIEDCIFRNNRDTGLQLSRYSSSANTIGDWPSNNLILRCESYDNKDSDNEDADGFAAKLTCGTGNVFKDCIAHHNIDDGWDLYTKSETGPIGIITLEGCIAHNNGKLTDGITSGAGDKNGYKLGSSAHKINHIVRRCIAFNNGKHGFTDNGNIGNIEFSNNTSFNNEGYNFHTRDGGGHTFVNNISFGTTQKDRLRGNYTAPNSFVGEEGGFAIDNSDFETLAQGPNSDPTVNGFLMLKEGSNLIDAGTNVTGISYNGSSPDLGAIEFGAVEPPKDPEIILSSTAGDGVVDLSWTVENLDVSALEVYRDTDPDPKGRSRIAFPASDSRNFRDTNVSNGTTYYYWVKANASVNSNRVSGTPGNPAIYLTTEAGDGSVALNWGLQDLSATALEVYRDTDADPKGRVRIAMVSADSRTYTDTNLDNGTTYYYWIKANASLNSNVASAQPVGSSKINLSANAGGDNITLSWSIENLAVSSLEIYRDTDSNPQGRSRIAMVSPDSRNFTDNEIIRGTTYYYWIKANASLNSNIASAATESGSAVRLSTSVENNSVTLFWDIEDLSVSSLEIYRDTDPDPKGRSRIAYSPTDSRAYTDSNVIPGTTYYYWIKANAFLNSNTASATPTNEDNTVNYDLIGYATLNGGTTGGEGGISITCSTGDCILEAIQQKKDGDITEPLIIYVNGTVTPSNTSASKIDVKEVQDISIIGVETDGLFDGIGIKIYKASNIIIQNVTVRNVTIGDKDAIGIEGPADHIWIDHCELYAEYQNVDKDYYDGLLDCKRDVEFITYSFNYLHDSWKMMLVGSSSSDTYDRKLTMHHNYFDNVNSRTPLYRGGSGHVFNNYYSGIGSTGINTRAGACLKVENNYFKDAINPIVWAYGDVAGSVDQSNNTFENVSWDFSSDSVNEPGSCQLSIPYPYSTSLHATEDVPSIVIAHAGVGKIGNTLSNFSQFGTSAKGELMAYPNPVGAANVLTINIPNYRGNEQIRIVNLLGKEVLKRPAKSNTEYIDVADFPSGQYIIQVKTTTSTQLKMFVK